MKIKIMEEQLTKKERRELRKEEERRKKRQESRMKKIKTSIWIAISVLIIGGGIFFISRFSATRPSQPQSQIISKQGIHWHADLTIKILGEYRDIPADIGVGITHNPLHTHKTDGVIHMEFKNIVRENDIRLSSFFKVWGEKFNENCIFDYCNSIEKTVKMLVNGQENQNFENYLMQNNDKIEIRYE